MTLIDFIYTKCLPPHPFGVLHAARKKGGLNWRFLFIVSDVSVEIGYKLDCFGPGTCLSKCSELVETIMEAGALCARQR